jgi:hypothetical protein
MVKVKVNLVRVRQASGLRVGEGGVSAVQTRDKLAVVEAAGRLEVVVAAVIEMVVGL